MYTLFSVLIIIVSILLILIVLIQNPKGGGLASNFSGSNQVMGVRKTADFLEKSTWTLAVALILFTLFAPLAMPKKSAEEQKSVIESKVKNTAEPNALPTFPVNPTEGNMGSDTTK